jgi:hypothetical protein
MYKLANCAEINAKWIPKQFHETCFNVVESVFSDQNLLDMYSLEQAMWMLRCCEHMGFHVNPEWWHYADTLDNGSESPVWDAVTMQQSRDAFIVMVKANWLSGCRLEFDIYPEMLLKPFEHLRPWNQESFGSADDLLDKLMGRL